MKWTDSLNGKDEITKLDGGSKDGVADRAEVLVERYFRELADDSKNKVFLPPYEDGGKLARAIKAYGRGLTKEDVLVFYDNTVFGRANSGFMLTDDAIYYKEIFSSNARLFYSEVDEVVVRICLGTDFCRVNGVDISCCLGDTEKVAMALGQFLGTISGKGFSEGEN